MALDNQNVQTQGQKNIKAFKAKDLSSQEKQYRKFLFYREFFAMDRPVILTEGKTDKVHLYAAIKKQAALYAQLADSTQSPATLKVRVFPGVERRTNALMGLSGGTANLASFISNYEDETKTFFKPLAREPIIVLVDLDDGWSSIQAVIKNKTKLKPDGKENFYRIGNNLYVVCIPPPPGATEGCIEDLYPVAILDTKIDGKSFDMSNKTQDHGLHYGKFVFAEKVIKPHVSTIDFSGFNPLLERISTVITHHHGLKP
jgi:5S rRNA maturation endonuclease (ribonuclease M5)